jgi:hypothetical protein
MKPHEEEWTVEWDADEGQFFIVNANYSVFAVHGHSRENARERARLAAQAPKMARLLKSMEWSGSSSYNGSRWPACPVCLNWRDDLSVRDDAKMKHRPDCALAVSLRDAGVIE